MKIYTRTGDDGTTSLAGGERVSKHGNRIEAYGTVDELISCVGLLAAMPECSSRNKLLVWMQERLMHCAALLAAGKGANRAKMVPPSEGDVGLLEIQMDEMEADMEPLTSFILPGGSMAVARVHIARTVCRRTERVILRLAAEEPVDPMIVKFINRLSDFLFVLARRIAFETGIDQPAWRP